MVCQEIKCPDYDTSDGEPAWCNWAGCPAIVAVKKCLEDVEKQKQKGEKHGKPEIKKTV